MTAMLEGIVPGPGCLVRASRSALWVDLGGECAVLLPSDGRIRLLKGTGAFLWPLLAQERPVFELCRLLEADFQVDRETCLGEVISLLRELVSLGLVEVAQ